jgi:prolipoprotein diacylglyceryl transferase
MHHFVWHIDPVLIHIGPLQLRWYGLLFVGSFFLALKIAEGIFKKEGKDPALLDGLLVYALVGTVIGARLMHCFAYEPHFYLSHPLEILKVWKGGLASHGGLLGVLIAFWLFAKRHKLDYIWLLSRMAIVGPVVAAAVRIGNFFNSEILGLPTNLPWAVVFSRVDDVARHPVQLYEALAYIALFFLLYGIWKKVRPQTATRIIPGLFLSVMFSVRFLLEYTKTRQAEYTWDLPLTTGQALSIPFILIGMIWFVWGVMRTKSTQG